MTKEQQKIFIKELIDNVQTEILNKVDKYPDNWDGIELRWLIADKFSQVVFGGYAVKRAKRHRKYYNTVIVNNLI